MASTPLSRQLSFYWLEYDDEAFTAWSQTETKKANSTLEVESPCEGFVALNVGL
jgi:hypothetical protein